MIKKRKLTNYYPILEKKSEIYFFFEKKRKFFIVIRSTLPKIVGQKCDNSQFSGVIGSTVELRPPPYNHTGLVSIISCFSSSDNRLFACIYTIQSSIALTCRAMVTYDVEDIQGTPKRTRTSKHSVVFIICLFGI